MTDAPLTVDWSIELPALRLGVIEAFGVTVGPSSDALRARIPPDLSDFPDPWPDDDVKNAVRDLLRGHGFKPTGRNKPASEFLVGAVARGAFPWINNLVDINNIMSFERCWPMSILDRQRALGDADALEIRHGRDDEAYVFNPAGHELRLAGLPGVARRGGPMIGNPVKDAMVAKVHEDTRDVVVFVYTSAAIVGPGLLGSALDAYAGLLREHAGAQRVLTQQLGGGA